jgi:hypothetical protein
MAYYVASYDLHNQRNYQPVWDALEKMRATRLLESLWVLTSGLTAEQIRDQIKNAADQDDSVAVIELKSGSWWATQDAREAGVQWLRQNIKA